MINFHFRYLRAYFVLSLRICILFASLRVLSLALFMCEFYFYNHVSISGRSGRARVCLFVIHTAQHDCVYQSFLLYRYFHRFRFFCSLSLFPSNTFPFSAAKEREKANWGSFLVRKSNFFRYIFLLFVGSTLLERVYRGSVRKWCESNASKRNGFLCRACVCRRDFAS